jgi:hypothetical protein
MALAQATRVPSFTGLSSVLYRQRKATRYWLTIAPQPPFPDMA